MISDIVRGMVLDIHRGMLLDTLPPTVSDIIPLTVSDTYPTNGIGYPLRLLFCRFVPEKRGVDST